MMEGTPPPHYIHLHHPLSIMGPNHYLQHNPMNPQWPSSVVNSTFFSLFVSLSFCLCPFSSFSFCPYPLFSSFSSGNTRPHPLMTISVFSIVSESMSVWSGSVLSDFVSSASFCFFHIFPIIPPVSPLQNSHVPSATFPPFQNLAVLYRAYYKI